MNSDFEIQKGALRKYRGHQKKVIIPSGVTFIANEAFNCCSTITDVIIPEGVVSIGNSAFAGCTNLKRIVIPQSTIILGTGAFTLCENLESIIIPEGVSSIKAHAFDGCRKLKSAQLPSTLIRLETSAFHWCASLKHLTIPDRVTNFGENLFNHCTSLTSLTYRGITINPNAYSIINISEILTMIHNKDFSIKTTFHAKTDVIFKLYFANPEDAQTADYIRKNFPVLFEYIILSFKDTELIQKILDSGAFVTAENIDTFIDFAIEKRKLEAQVMLTDYKAKHIGYESTEEIISRKFQL